MENIKKVFKITAVMVVNRFPMETEVELQLMEDKCRELWINMQLYEVWTRAKSAERISTATEIRLWTDACLYGEDAVQPIGRPDEVGKA